MLPSQTSESERPTFTKVPHTILLAANQQNSQILRLAPQIVGHAWACSSTTQMCERKRLAESSLISLGVQSFVLPALTTCTKGLLQLGQSPQMDMAWRGTEKSLCP
eukprot:1160758-Pelagomonas_calceolata.AAC.5